MPFFKTFRGEVKGIIKRGVQGLLAALFPNVVSKPTTPQQVPQPPTPPGPFTSTEPPARPTPPPMPPIQAFPTAGEVPCQELVISGEWVNCYDNSTNVDQFRYMYVPKSLETEFWHKRIYGYRDVPPELFCKFIETDSPGHFVWIYFRYTQWPFDLLQDYAPNYNRLRRG